MPQEIRDEKGRESCVLNYVIKKKTDKIRFYQNEDNRVKVLSNLKMLKDEEKRENGYPMHTCRKKLTLNTSQATNEGKRDNAQFLYF